MNNFARKCLDAIWTDAKGAGRYDPNHYQGELQMAHQLIMENFIEYHACYFWAIYDSAQLQAMFDRQTEFSTDIAEMEDTWAMAYQMGITEFELNPPLLPEYTEAEIKAWVEDRRHSKPVQLAFSLP